jgi:hypothetical protein
MLGPQVSITTGYLDSFVPQLLYGAQVNTSHNKPTGKCMSEAMSSELLNASLLYRSLKPLAWFRQLLTVAVQKHMLTSISLGVG